MKPASLPVPFAALTLTLLLPACASRAAVPVYGYRVVHSYPHDTAAYTEGLFYRDGYLYESTGNVGESSIRKVELATGRVLQQHDLPPPDYGEGIVAWRNTLIELTWQSHKGYTYDLDSFRRTGSFSYPGEGWALTANDRHLLMSDGTPIIRVLDPQTLSQVSTLLVTAEGSPVKNLNELEWVNGELYANVWLTQRIARIDPASGDVVGWIDLAGLGPASGETADPTNDVLNGIAWDGEGKRLFVTGKRWPKIYEIELVPPK
ncbi:glutaminyl-peptide cyclotransferase [Dyella sp.]|jgi:glutaminyl-peptide cyclotransferase|uniref:glutaminyl-peptide cyclotransferase n=1 Tax=Dyella sp. TaxID=1869338 RepID=UPI002D793880|nr:glutaminyl-peptide cyclotransferase [Dyella sp.]HET6431974.1 glutaminyl-peptide cyclotransferase [Dyella sp.]